MLGNMITAVLAIVLLFMLCDAVWQHVLGSDVRFVSGRTDNRSFLERMAFAFDNFCDKVNHTSEYRKMKLEKGFGGWKDDDII